ncbi:serine/threonine-protein kinase [Nocardiopsis ganjiahuensis]|uniref:serine/threonine-protein kinase n=1 Tax=Nocardiopsis ganjiahuensis TaxID=239984 RepID=UPI00034C8298|nr:serine/threonine-protein kinase [Nocardiopsis ganjiahuensis]
MDFSLPALPPNVTPLTDGDPLQVGRYRLIGRLGADGMGTVFAAVSPDHEPIALKIAGAEWAPGADVSGEATLTRQVGGVCAAGARDSGTHEGRPWSAIEYVPGFGLQQHVRVHGRSGGGALLVLAAGMAEALATLHATGLVHGDVRPGNVVASADGPKVLDFGIVRRIDAAAPVQSAKSLGWLAPECYDGSAATQASDVHGWASLVVFAATGEPPFGASPAGHTPGRIPGQILWEMARRAREARVDLRALPEDLRPLLQRAFSPDPEARPSAEEAYLECLLMLGIDEQATADTWPDKLRELIGDHWPKPDLSWHDRARWTDAALARDEGRPMAGSAGGPGGAGAVGAAGAAGTAGGSGVSGGAGSADAPVTGASAGTGGAGGSGVSGGYGSEAVGPGNGPTAGAGAAPGHGTGRGADPGIGGNGTAPDEEWGPEAAAEAYGHTPRGYTEGRGGDRYGPVPGARSSGTAGAPPGGASSYLFGPSQTGGHDLSDAEGEGIDLEGDDDGTGRKSRVGMWLGVGALGMAVVLGGGYFLFDTLTESPADTVVADEPAEEPVEEDGEDESEDGTAPEALDCADSERVSAQEAHAPWRPFNPEAASPDLYVPLLTPGPEGEPSTNPDVWPFVSPLDHDTVDFGLVTPGLDAFPVMSVCMTGVRDTGAGVEFTVELTYHPNVGTHPVYEEDFLTLMPLDPGENGGLDKEVIRGGSGSALGLPMTTLTVLGPENPTAEVDVLIPGAPERAGVAYRPSAHSGALVDDMSGHCYDVNGTLEWRDEERLGSGFFALPGSAPGESDMTQCPVDGAGGETGDEIGNGSEGRTGDGA